MISTILVLSPHTDDGELAAGGTISKFINDGKKVYYVAFSSCEESVPDNCIPDILKDECRDATKKLGIPENNFFLRDYKVREFPKFRQEILEDMVKLNKEINPDLILIPSSNDIHQDHKTIHYEALRAFKKTASIWGYEHPWNNFSFTTDIFVNLSEENLQTKIDALKKYTSQNIRDYFSEDYIKSLANTRGMQVGYKYAETFELLRLLVK